MDKKVLRWQAQRHDGEEVEVVVSTSNLTVHLGDHDWCVHGDDYRMIELAAWLTGTAGCSKPEAFQIVRAVSGLQRVYELT